MNDWKQSSFCNGASSCAEVAHEGDMVLLRSSVQPERVVSFDADEWRAFIEGVKAGEFDG